MKKVGVCLPKLLLDGLDRLVREGIYPNRAEAIRIAVRDMLFSEGAIITHNL